jgi:hypothetical protein
MGEELVSVEIFPGPKVEMYCKACYEDLLKSAVKHLPELTSFVNLSTAPAQLQVPEYLIKDNSFMQLFFPTDAIDLGVLRQRRRQERGLIETEEVR